MKYIAVSQRVIEETRYHETRDALDQRWAHFLLACGFAAVPIPNHPETAQALMAGVDFTGVLLTGGSDHPARSATTDFLFAFSAQKRLPVIGVCHGMQLMQRACGLSLEQVTGHVQPEQTILIDGVHVSVNSYHDFGTRDTAAELDVWAVADDGVVKAIRSRERRWLGMMWHPERIEPFAQRDIAYFKEWFA